MKLKFFKTEAMILYQSRNNCFNLYQRKDILCEVICKTHLLSISSSDSFGISGLCPSPSSFRLHYLRTVIYSRIHCILSSDQVFTSFDPCLLRNVLLLEILRLSHLGLGELQLNQPPLLQSAPR